MVSSLYHMYKSCRRWRDVEPRDEVLRVVAKPILLPPLISCNHQFRGARTINAGRHSRSQDDSLKVVNSKAPELVAVGHATATSAEASSGSSLVLPTMSTDPLLRISQLEQNIRFLHEQHQHMLGNLHNEIEMLRQRNRDLQFQLVFTKKGAIFGQQTSSESSPDEESAKPKVPPVSPNQKCNTQNLQVEILEKELNDLKTSLNELNEKNKTMTKELYDQKELLDEAVNKEGEYQSRLDDADKLIKSLRKENDEQRREITMLRAQLNDRRQSGSMSGGRQGSGGPRKTGGSGGSSGGNTTHGGGYNNNSSRDRNYSTGSSGGRENLNSPAGVNMQQQENTRNHGQQRFPPLHSQQFRQRAPRQPNSDTGVRPQSSGNTGRPNIRDENAVLPHLQHQQKHYNNYSNNGCQQNKPNRYYGGNRHYIHNNQHYYYNNYKGGGNSRPGNSRDQHSDIKQNGNKEDQFKQEQITHVDPDQG